jgi:hypothetical protein
MVYPKYFTHHYARFLKKTPMQELHRKHVVSSFKKKMEIVEDLEEVKIM